MSVGDIAMHGFSMFYVHFLSFSVLHVIAQLLMIGGQDDSDG